jgi:NodT family efflux transporter outer membrane factor (OMF) lipoprotein
MRAPLLIVIFGASLLAGCTVGPTYVKPEVPVEAVYAEQTSLETTNPPPGDWWKTFNDPELDKLIQNALRTNYDLQIAYSRVRQSRFQRNITAADLFPQVDADAGYSHTRGSQSVVLPLGGSSGSGSSGGAGAAGASAAGSGASPQTKASRAVSKAEPQSSGSQSGSQAGAQNDAAFDDQLSPLGKGGLPGVVTDLYQLGFDATWEIDVFGAKRRQVEAATANLEAAEENRRRIALTVMAEVARNYFELRGLQARLDIARKNLAAQSNILELTTSQARSGLAPDTDAVRARAQVETTASTIPPLLAQERTLSHALSILVGQEPGALNAQLAAVQPLPPTPPVVSAGLPSALLRRRPDIRAAERNIAAANAQVGSAVADLFPKFALTGSAGLDSSTTQHLFDWESRYFLISPTVSWRIFDAGRIMSNIRLQKALADEAALQYRSTLLQALQDVENALVSYGMEQERLNRLRAAFQQNQVALDLETARYQHGLATFLEVLDAERSVLSSQDELAQSTSASITDLVALYKALGGGWPAAAPVMAERK